MLSNQKTNRHHMTGERLLISNNTGGPLTNLKFRVIDITTFPAPSGIADLRPRTSTLLSVANPCGGPAVNLEGTALEQPPSQPNGGGFNSSHDACCSAKTILHCHNVWPQLEQSSLKQKNCLGPRRLAGQGIHNVVIVEAGHSKSHAWS